MYKSKKYASFYDDFDDEKTIESMCAEILNDEELPSLDEIIIGCWVESWDDSGQAFVDMFVENAEKFSHIKSLFIGDMESEECEVSWIIQANYEKLWEALPNLKELTIKGSTDLILGEISHENLENLTIICGGLPQSVIESIEKAHLPNLKTLNLYLGVDDYGFDGDIDTIRSLLEHSDFPNLTYLGLGDSDIEDEIAEAVLNSKYIHQITTLDLSNGTLTDKGGQLLLDRLPELSNLTFVDLNWHYLSDPLAEKLKDLENLENRNLEIDVSDPQVPDDYDGEIWLYPMLTE